MSSALVELRQLAEGIDTPTDITSVHQEFFYHLVEFKLGRGESSEVRQWKTDLMIKAYGLYKGIMSRDPVRALSYRVKINQAEIKRLCSENTFNASIPVLSAINNQIDIGDINLNLFAGDTGKAHMTHELEALKDYFKVGLQQKYNLAQTIKQAFKD